jgi:short subunit dehydrogenase-like uncharacterized protein
VAASTRADRRLPAPVAWTSGPTYIDAVSHLRSDFLLYGATGFVGSAAARLAVRSGLRPVLAGRDASKLEPLAAELGLEFRTFDLDDPDAMDRALGSVPVVLHGAGPYRLTAMPFVEACLRTNVHYLDLTGELPVLEALAARDAEARARGIMLLPAVGFDVVPTDCLAVHLHHRLPSATRLTLAFHSDGPAGFPPGTQRTAIDLVPFGNRVRRNGQLVVPARTPAPRMIDFGQGPLLTRWLLWGDLFTAYRSTGIPDIDNYAVQPDAARRLVALAALLRPVFKLAAVRKLAGRAVKPGPTLEDCAQTVTHVWGEVVDAEGRKVVSRLHGPEAGLVWTTRAALAVVRKVLAGHAPAGFQTPGLAYGADFALECEGVTREDVPT